MQNILIIGCGSIGARHAHNARALGLDVMLCDPDVVRAEALAAQVGAKVVFSNLSDALAQSTPDAALVATPSGLHVEAALLLARQGTPMLMEKPLATSLTGLDELLKAIEEKKVVTMMAQSYRFHEGMRALKSMLGAGAVGTVVSAQYVSKEYLPHWHLGRDYRQEYAAQKKLGGGAMFTSMSHTLDFIEWLFGSVADMEGRKERLGDLEMDADDTAEVCGTTVEGVQFTAHNDYVSKLPMHTLHVVGERGEVLLDLHANLLNKKPYAFEQNKRYVDELAYFIELVRRGKSDTTLDVEQGAHIVALLCSSIQDLTN